MKISILFYASLFLQGITAAVLKRTPVEPIPIDNTKGTSPNPAALVKREWVDCSSKGDAHSKACFLLYADLCQAAIQRFDPSRYYTSYASRIEWDQSLAFGVGAGCIAEYFCEDMYPEGVTGYHLIDAFNKVYLNGCEKCGTWHWDNGCSFRLNYCQKCWERG